MNAAANANISVVSDLADHPVRWSWLSHFLSSALHAKEAALHGKEPTPAMKLGTAGHVVTFEQPYDVFRAISPKTGKTWNRNSKAWDEFETDCEARGVTPLTVAEYDKACRIRDALRGHADAAPLLFGMGVVREQTIRWSRDGRACSSRPDARKPGDWIVDLKCCRTAKPDRFARGFKWTTYPGQFIYYREADCYDTGRSVDRLGPDLYCVAIEPFAPFAITVFELDATARDYGAGQVTTCWEQLTEAERFNRWGGYSESIVQLSIESDDGDLTFVDAEDAPNNDSDEENH